MQFFLILASLVSVAAFAPASRMATSAALRMSFEDALGAQAPLGFWDPLGKITMQLDASSSPPAPPIISPPPPLPPPPAAITALSCIHLLIIAICFLPIALPHIQSIFHKHELPDANIYLPTALPHIHCYFPITTRFLS